MVAYQFAMVGQVCTCDNDNGAFLTRLGWAGHSSRGGVLLSRSGGGVVHLAHGERDCLLPLILAPPIVTLTRHEFHATKVTLARGVVFG